MHSANKRVKAALQALGIECEIILLDKDTRTSAAAALAVNCSISQIAKSLIFRTQSGEPALAVTSGGNRVCLDLLGGIIGEPVSKADADFVREKTGFVIGGVAPVGFVAPVRTLYDRSLFQFETVWAAGGTPNSLFAISQADLYRLADGQIYDFAESSG